MLAKLNSLTIGSFKHSTDEVRFLFLYSSLSPFTYGNKAENRFDIILCPFQQANGSDDGHCPLEPPDGEIPKSSSTISLEIPNSTTLWEADPRPPYSPEVKPNFLP